MQHSFHAVELGRGVDGAAIGWRMRPRGIRLPFLNLSRPEACFARAQALWI